MAETSAGLRSGSAVFGGSGAALVAGLLRDAERAARDGAVRQAREICADLVLHHLPWFAADRALLARLVGALLATGSGGLLRRVLAATTGCSLRMLPAEGPAAPEPAADGAPTAGERLVDRACRDASASLARA